ncbi:MAG TPA: lytic murein transglycosylase [Solirubrobacteraceae bacterium]|nr:lytic murein transglycosylase [Solirubrobacteraceae bacterium]
MRSRKLLAVLATAAAVFVAWALSVVPTASADDCTVTVTLVTGQVLVFHVNVAPGTPISAMGLPITGPVASESEQCAPSTTTTPTVGVTTTTTTTTAPTTSTSSSSTPTNSGTTKTSTSTSPSHSGGGSSSSSSTSTTGTTPVPTGSSHGEQPSSSSQSKAHKKKTQKKTTTSQTSTTNNLPTGKGVPSSANPTFSLSLPGPAPIGVPNFFIDSFRIPPFLIPIYQAAGIEYQIPWQVLAAINEIETDYGRNLSVSSAGAVGWMQFLPSTWKEWGVDANGDGVADPYNPVDAIFTAARYLHAAGASTNVAKGIFAYNHASWYVQSVLLRAKLIGGIPSQLIGALTGLVEGHFPVAAPAKYADSSVVKLAKDKVKGSNAAIAIDSNPNAKGTSIYAKKGSPVIAVNDGKIVGVGTSKTLGHYVKLQDATGNIYTYAQLGTVSKRYPVPKPVKSSSKQIIKQFSVPASKAPTSAASAGTQVLPKTATTISKAATKPSTSTPSITGPASAGTQTTGKAAKSRTPASASAADKAASSAAGAASSASQAASQAQSDSASVTAPMVKERLFANPNRPASYAAGGNLQLKNTAQQITNFRNYFSDTLHLAKNQYTLKSLKKGAIVIAGTVLGRIGGPSQGVSPHLYFTIQPAGKNAPDIDPKPILDGWKLLEATAVYRASGVDPFFGPGAKNPSVGQVLLMSKQQLTTRVLTDPHVQVYACGRRDIEAGLIDRRVLAVIEFLSASGLDPDVSGLECGHSATGATGTDSAGATGASVDISKINGIPVAGHQQPGSITDITIRRLLTLQGSMRPNQIISDISYKSQSNTLALPDHKNRIQITYTPDFGTNNKLSKQIKSILQPGQWIQLINRISQIPEPVVPISPSKYAIQEKSK